MQQGAPDLARASYIAHMNQTWAQSRQTFVIMAAGYLGTDSGGPVTIDCYLEGPDNWLFEIAKIQEVSEIQEALWQLIVWNIKEL